MPLLHILPILLLPSANILDGRDPSWAIAVHPKETFCMQYNGLQDMELKAACMVSSLQSSESCSTCKPAKFQKASKYSLSPRQCYGPPISHNLRLVVYLMFCWMVKEGKTHVKLKGSCFQNQNMEQPSSWKSCPPVAVRWRWWMPAMALGQWLLSIFDIYAQEMNANTGLVFYKILFSVNILWRIIFWRSTWDIYQKPWYEWYKIN